jgi:hypothetical protein
MAIKRISRWQFNQFVPKNFFLESVVGDQVAWWADEPESIIGTIARGVTESCWRYIVLEQDADGGFRVCNMQSGIRSRLAASAQLVRAMEAIQESKQNRLPSGRLEPSQQNQAA